MRHLTIRSIYSFLFFSDTGMPAPPGFSSRSVICHEKWPHSQKQSRTTATHHRIQSHRQRPPTCPKTSSLTVKVRSSMSSMSLSFIHCRLWWNSSSRNSRSLRSQGLKWKWVIHKVNKAWTGDTNHTTRNATVTVVFFKPVVTHSITYVHRLHG